MPQASDDLRDLMNLMFNNSTSDAGPTQFLTDRGYVLGGDWLWDLPNKNFDHFVTEKEELCLRFLVDEWDFGWIRQYKDVQNGR